MKAQLRKVAVIFLVGVSGGAISAVFPRLFTSLALASTDVNVQLLSSGFWLVALAFAVTIGISMIWLYSETSETVKNLFVASLSLPAVLSGAINMSNTASTAQSALAQLQSDTAALSQSLESVYSINSVELGQDASTAVEYIDIPLGRVFSPLDLLGIGAAHAQEPARVSSTIRSQSPRLWSPSVRFQSPQLVSNYVVSLAMASSLEDATEAARTLAQQPGVPALHVIKTPQNQYLVTTVAAQSRTDALLTAINLRQENSALNLSLVKLPE